MQCDNLKKRMFLFPWHYFGNLFERKRRRKLRSNFRRSWSEFIILRIHMTENGSFFGTKSGSFGNQNYTAILFTTLIQLPMAGVKMKIKLFFWQGASAKVASATCHLPWMGPKSSFLGHISSFFLWMHLWWQKIRKIWDKKCIGLVSGCLVLIVFGIYHAVYQVTNQQL
jgi:hypothetical protein